MPVLNIAKTLATQSRVVLENIPAAARGYTVAREFAEQSLLVVVPDEDGIDRWMRDLAAFGVTDVVAFPADPHVPFDSVARDSRIDYTQFAIRHRLQSTHRPRVLVTQAAALQHRWMPIDAFDAHTALWVPGEEMPLAAMGDHLMRCGFNRVNLVEDPGTFAVRGSVVDCFVPGVKYPIRIDLFGDDIASMKCFDPQSQKPLEELEFIAVHPIRSLVFEKSSVKRSIEALGHLAETQDVPSRLMREMAEEIELHNYFYGIETLWPLFFGNSEPVIDTLISDDTLVIFDDGAEIDNILQTRWQDAQDHRERTKERNELAIPVEQLMDAPELVQDKLANNARVVFERLVIDGDNNPSACTTINNPFSTWDELTRELNLRRQHGGRGRLLEPVVNTLKSYIDKRSELFFACNTLGNAHRLIELLRDYDVDMPRLDGLPDVHSFGEARRHPRTGVAVAPLTGGFGDPANKFGVITDVELFGSRPKVKRKGIPKAPRGALTTLHDLREGDHVIHVDHGIGQYMGLKRLVLAGADGDYVHLEYAGGDKLYLPIFRINLLQRYNGPADPKCDKLGGTRWEKTKQRVKDAVLAIAHDLLALQARRKTHPGVAMPTPNAQFREFEASFPFEETPDQERAIADVTKDLGKATPMDRLICGDVGFGKTEVAMRAAFQTILGGHQVAILVPTTVLAEQHGVSFGERLTPHGARVGVLSRFRSKKQSTHILEGLASGNVDVIVGTHRLLSGDVAFKKLGLLIVDEEQRFGVKHKERIKALRSQVHVLTLSATPIPRTLNMAMVGLRDLSLIQTPPVARTSIKTEVTRFDETLIGDAIRRELRRGGQVFVVHNRVQSIEGIANVVQQEVPEAKIAIAHGQMPGEQLEQIMVRFVRREFNVLICTTIIESGIDIPSANTMIINRADTFGLAQLHQLRGRIGRGRDRAYAYLLLPRAGRLSHEASQRLAVLKRFSDLGAGFHIASQDLEIRGAGDLLGAEQSGSIKAVGFELYTELLSEAVEKVRGQQGQQEVEPDIKLPVAAVLPESYVQQPIRRLEYYQRMATAHSDEEIFDVRGEIEEFYGEAPPEVYHLTEVMMMRRRLKSLGASALSAAVRGDQIAIGVTFLQEANIDPVDLAERLQREPQRYRMLPSGKLQMTVPTMPNTEDLHLLQRVRRELDALKTLPEAGRLGDTPR